MNEFSVKDDRQKCGKEKNIMVELEGKIFSANIVLKQSIVKSSANTKVFVKELEDALVALCRSLEIPIPLWLSKNTHEFAAFRQTLFFADQFTEDVSFDRFQIRLLRHE